MTGIEMGCDRSCILILSNSKEGAILEKQSIVIRIILKCNLRCGVYGCEGVNYVSSCSILLTSLNFWLHLSKP
jgi:hypothetical protein